MRQRVERCIEDVECNDVAIAIIRLGRWAKYDCSIVVAGSRIGREAGILPTRMSHMS